MAPASPAPDGLSQAKALITPHRRQRLLQHLIGIEMQCAFCCSRDASPTLQSMLPHRISHGCTRYRRLSRDPLNFLGATASYVHQAQQRPLWPGRRG